MIFDERIKATHKHFPGVPLTYNPTLFYNTVTSDAKCIVNNYETHAQNQSSLYELDDNVIMQSSFVTNRFVDATLLPAYKRPEKKLVCGITR